MGFSSKSMARPIFLLVLSLLLIPASTHLQSNEEGFISVLLSDKGIEFAKDVLINEAISSMMPLQLPDIEKSVKIPLVGKVQIVLSDITIYSLGVDSSHIETGDTGITLVVSGATANLSMKWRYSYTSWLVVISDNGVASVQVKGMEVGLTVAIKEQAGTLKLSLLDCGCLVKDISIKLDGGASWLYQGVVDAFQGPIGSAVEDAITEKIKEGIVTLDSLLQSVPKQIPVDNVAAMNVTFVESPVLSNSSIEFEINGLFTAVDNILVPNYYSEQTQASLSCNDPAKMIRISLHEFVFNSAALVYFNAGYMHWIIDKIPDQYLLNTAAWRFVCSQLYIEYPNDDMNLNVSVTAPPIIKITEHSIDVSIFLDVTVNVLDAGEVIPVACVSLVIDTSCSPQILRNNLAGILKLKNLTVSLKWSKIGKLHMHLIEATIFTAVKAVFIPYVNLHLIRGFPLPLIHGFVLQNAEIHCNISQIVVCSNLAFL